MIRRNQGVNVLAEEIGNQVISTVVFFPKLLVCGHSPGSWKNACNSSFETHFASDTSFGLMSSFGSCVKNRM